MEIFLTGGIAILMLILAFMGGFGAGAKDATNDYASRLGGVGIEKIEHHSICKDGNVISNWYEIVWKDDVNKKNIK